MASCFSIAITLVDELGQGSIPSSHLLQIARELLEVCRHGVFFLSQFTTALQAHDVAKARALLVHQPSPSLFAEFHALPTLCTLLGREGVSLEVWHGCASIKVHNIPLLDGEHAATLVKQVQSELAGTFGIVFCANVVGEQSPAIPMLLSVHESVSSDAMDTPCTVPRPDVNQPSLVAVIEVDRCMNQRTGNWCAAEARRVLHRHRMELPLWKSLASWNASCSCGVVLTFPGNACLPATCMAMAMATGLFRSG